MKAETGTELGGILLVALLVGVLVVAAIVAIHPMAAPRNGGVAEWECSLEGIKIPMDVLFSENNSYSRIGNLSFDKIWCKGRVSGVVQ